MKRKIIELGNNCMVLSLPIKWVRENNLKKGDEIDAETVGKGLLISPGTLRQKKKEITLEVADDDSSTRMEILNSYRLGYDKIEVKGASRRNCEKIVQLMIGFEFFEKGAQTFIFESVAEPDYENFDSLMTRQLHTLDTMIREFPSNAEATSSESIQKYDSFLKRCMTKKKMSQAAENHYWQFLSQITKISRNLYYFQKYIDKYNLKLSPQDKLLMTKLGVLFSKAEKAFLQKNSKLLTEIHRDYNSLMESCLSKTAKSSHIVTHFVLLTAYNIYHLTSPISGLLQSSEQ